MTDWLLRGGMTRLVRWQAPMTLVGLALVLVALWLTSGCGATALQTQARAATVTASTLTLAQQAVSDARSHALDRVEEEHPDDPEHDAAVLEEAARWRPVGAALDSARDALLTWVQSIELAHLAGSDGVELLDLVPLVARVVLLYADVVELSASLGVEIPALPAIVTSLASTYGGGR